MPIEPTARQIEDPSGFACRLRGDVVLSCAGELDPTTTPALGRSLDRLIGLAPERIVVELSAVTFLDAGAIGELVGVRTRARAAGGDLVVRAPSPFGRRMLSIVGRTDLIVDEDDGRSRSTGTSQRADGPSGQVVEVAGPTDLHGSARMTLHPSSLISEILEWLESSSSWTPAARAVAAAAQRDGSSGATAVMHLWALRDVLHAQPSEGPRAASESQVRRRLELEAALAKAAWAMLAELEQTTLLDPLTGLLNRRALDRDLLRWVAAARRHAHHLSVVMIDVEGLKATNDRLGHAAGDEILRGLATSLTAALRAEDNAYRIGGDEFVLVLPQLRPDDVEPVMERTIGTAHGAFTWGCAWMVGDEGGASDAERAALLLAQADQRMLEHRAHVREGRGLVGSTPHQGDFAGRFGERHRSSVVIEEARGVIAEHFGVGITDASLMLGAFAVARGQSIVSVAAALMSRTVDVGELSSYAPSVGT